MQPTPLPNDSPYLIVGLGNPGPKYAGTRHNAGFMVLDALAKQHGLQFSQKQGNAEVARGQIGGVRAILAKPQTFMNLSGRAVVALANFYKVPHSRIIVVYDDIALPIGALRIREKGSAGGHNGVSNIIQQLGTQTFPRIRVGVDRPVQVQHSQIDWVLGRFTKEEREAMDAAIPRAIEAVEAILGGGIERAMNAYNTIGAGATKSEGRKTKDEKAEPRAASVSIAEKKPQPSAQAHQEEPTRKENHWVERLRNLYRKGELKEE